MTDIQKNMNSSDFNMVKINAEELTTHLSCSVASKNNMVIVGHRGTGKTAISKQVIKASDHTEIYINLSLFERCDLSGYPKVLSLKESNDARDQFIDYLLPRMYEPLLFGNKKCVILFDEADKADPSILAPLLEILQEKSINGQSLTNLSSCILTGNLISEGGSRLSPPLLDRAEKYLLETNAEIWLKWAALTGEIHPSIITFIRDNNHMLCGNAEMNENYADESPRGWHLASKTIKFGEENNWSKNIITEKVAGFVGKRAGIEYNNYYNHYQNLLPLADRVFKGDNIKSDYKSLEMTEKLIVCFIIGSRFSNKLDETNKEAPTEMIKRIGEFFSIVELENAIAAIRGTLGLGRIAKHRLHQDKQWKPMLDQMHDEMYQEQEKK